MSPLGTKKTQLMEKQNRPVFSLKPTLLTEKGVGSVELSGEDLPSAVLVLSWRLPSLAGCVGVYWSQLRPKCLNYLGTPRIKLLPAAGLAVQLQVPGWSLQVGGLG